MSSSCTSKKRNAAAQSQTPMKNQENYEQQSKYKKPMIMGVPYIPMHIVFDILSRVEIKTLFNSRLVCKSWAALISTPEFADLHLSRSPTTWLMIQSKGVLHSADRECPYIRRSNKLVFIPEINLPDVPIRLLNSFNGLVCFFQLISYASKEACNIYVCNPLLREYITLPKPPSFTKFDFASRACAFGFSCKTNQYKVVLSSFCASSCTLQTYIYTLGEGSWRSIESGPYGIENHNYYAFLNGSIHWIPLGLQCTFICCFDFVSEQFGGVPFPSEFAWEDRHLFDQKKVGVINGDLSICDFSHPDHIAIWVMKDYGVKESWSKDIVIRMISDPSYYSYEPIMTKSNGEILMIYDNESIVLYDPTSEAFGSKRKIFGVRSKFHAVAHVPSIISLKDVVQAENLKECTSN